MGPWIYEMTSSDHHSDNQIVISSFEQLFLRFHAEKSQLCRKVFRTKVQNCGSSKSLRSTVNFSQTCAAYRCEKSRNDTFWKLQKTAESLRFDLWLLFDFGKFWSAWRIYRKVNAHFTLCLLLHFGSFETPVGYTGKWTNMRAALLKKFLKVDGPDGPFAHLASESQK